MLSDGRENGTNRVAGDFRYGGLAIRWFDPFEDVRILASQSLDRVQKRVPVGAFTRHSDQNCRYKSGQRHPVTAAFNVVSQLFLRGLVGTFHGRNTGALCLSWQERRRMSSNLLHSSPDAFRLLQRRELAAREASGIGLFSGEQGEGGSQPLQPARPMGVAARSIRHWGGNPAAVSVFGSCNRSVRSIVTRTRMCVLHALNLRRSSLRCHRQGRVA